MLLFMTLVWSRRAEKALDLACGDALDEIGRRIPPVTARFGKKGFSFEAEKQNGWNL